MGISVPNFCIFGITPQELQISGYKVGYNIALVLLHKTAYLSWPYTMCGDRYLGALSLFLGIRLPFIELHHRNCTSLATKSVII